jgi:hypothetical protein
MTPMRTPISTSEASSPLISRLRTVDEELLTVILARPLNSARPRSTPLRRRGTSLASHCRSREQGGGVLLSAHALKDSPGSVSAQ